MIRSHLLDAVKGARIGGVLLICLGVILGGCGSPEPRLSPAAQALKTEVLGEINYLTEQLVPPVANRDWEAVKPVLQASYENVTGEGKPVPWQIVVLDANGISRVRFPSELEGHFDFSNYKPAKTVFNKKKKVQAALYLKGAKIFIVLAPLLQKDKVLGAVALAFSAGELQKTWQVSEEEFLSLDLNQ